MEQLKVEGSQKDKLLIGLNNQNDDLLEKKGQIEGWAW